MKKFGKKIQEMLRDISLWWDTWYFLEKLAPFLYKVAAFMLASVLGYGIYVHTDIPTFFSFVATYYPRAGEQASFSDMLVEKHKITKRLKEMLFVLPLIGFSLAPLVLSIKNKVLFWMSIPAAFIAYFIYNVGVLPLGNVFYPACIYCKSDRHIYSLLNNHLFKFVLAFLVALALLVLIHKIIETIFIKRTKVNTFRTLLVLGFFSILFIPEDIYDRYALPLIMFLIIFVIKDLKIKTVSLGITLLFLIMGLFITHDFYKIRELQTKQAYEITRLTGRVASIYSYDTLIFYRNSIAQKDYVGDRFNEYKSSSKPECFVQAYTIDSQGTLSDSIKRIEKTLDKIIENPKNHDAKKKNISWIKNNENKIFINEEYPSFLYNPVGKKAFVGSYCVNGK